MSQSELFAKVIVDAPGLSPLDYSIPSDMLVAVGDRVLVGLRSRTVVGVVVAISATSDYPEQRLRLIKRVLKDTAPLTEDWLALTRFTAQYYVRAWGETAIPTLPVFFRRVPGVRYANQMKKIRELTLSKRLPVPRPVLNKEQQFVVDKVSEATGYSPFLLFGVTGSGKTEVYLRIIENTLKKDTNAQILLLVPEINLTPQLEARVKERFPEEQIVSLHSEHSDTVRARSWLAVHEGRARILVGTRMSIFSSFKKLSLIIVDEEHDSSFKSGDGSRYSARDLAVWRAFRGKIPIVLGSATPSLESWVNATEGNYNLLRMTKRAIGEAKLPEVRITDVPSHGSGMAFTSVTVDAIQKTLEAGHQVLVFINRRGYSPVLSCPSCGWVSSCCRCSTFAVFHKGTGKLVCHHCGWQTQVPVSCPNCGNLDILPRGIGTERVEEELRNLFPEREILRIDRDAVSRKKEAEVAFQKVHQGLVDILVGTQIIAKGHDFKNVGLVVILNADAQLLSPDPRAKEKLFSTLMQVAGRAGRQNSQGTVLIQTRFPSDPIFGALEKQDYVAFTEPLVQERRDNWSVPFVYQALLTAQAASVAEALYFLETVAKSAELIRGEGVRVFDPVPMSLMRLMDMERAQLLVEADTRTSLNRFLWQWQAGFKVPSGVSWTIEVDPVSV